MMFFEKNDSIVPICPHCKKQIRKICYQEMKGDLGKRSVYICPECSACLGFHTAKV